MFENPEIRQRLMWALGLTAVVLLVSDLASVLLLGRHALSAPTAPAAQVSAPANPVMPAATAAMPATPAATPAVSTVTVGLQNSRVSVTIALQGGRVQGVLLKQYQHEITEPAGYTLLQGTGPTAEYVAAGWQGGGLEGPNEQSVWALEADQNTPDRVSLVWRNATGQAFQRTFTLQPDGYVVNVTERAFNSATLPVTLTPFVQIHRAAGEAGTGYAKNEKSNFVNYFGPMGLTMEGDNQRLHEAGFADVQDTGQAPNVVGSGGWWGFSSQYFLTAIVPGGDVSTTRGFRYAPPAMDATSGQNVGVFSASLTWPGLVIAPNTEQVVTYQIYAGPKHYAQLKELGQGLQQAISWGWFEPIVKGLYYLLVWFHGWAGNWGGAVLLLTLALKLATFPLANTSYRAMAKMKKLQPEVEILKEKFKDDQQGMAMAMMNLYKEKKVNPLSGCWPMLIQIPIFFAMYKVVLVAFEFRHAPLGLWIEDLSAMDPFFVLPILMGASMWVQFKLNPPPTDPMQAAIFKWMPLLMTVMFLWFPSGLVLYWLCNNVLSIAQQWMILRKERAI
jgi:YidC/Oxa1 family membrane protein insertase